MGGQEYGGEPIPSAENTQEETVTEGEILVAADLFAYGEELKETLTSDELSAVLAGMSD